MSRSQSTSTSNISRIIIFWTLLASNAHAFLNGPNVIQSSCNAQRARHQLSMTTKEQEFYDYRERRQSTSVLSRRNALGVAATVVATSWNAFRAMAADEDDQYVQRGNGFAYKFVYPSDFEPGAKPVKTHLFEINWKSINTPKYTFGITIDPVRISSLKEVRVL